MIKSLKSNKKIKKIFNDGFLIKEGGLVLRGYDFKDGEAQFGVAVSKKIFRSAVKRNLLKRRLRESVRKFYSSSPFPNGVSFFLLYNLKKVWSSKNLYQKTKLLLDKLSEN